MGKRVAILLTHVLLMVSSGIFLTLICQPLFVWQLQFLDTQLLLGLSTEQVIANYNTLLYYLLNPFEQVLQMPDIATSAQGAWHFKEVKQLFFINNLILVVSAAVFMRWGSDKQLSEEDVFLSRWYTKMKWVPTIVASVIAVVFNSAFIVFHHLFFHNDAWVFDPAKDPIILVLPETFFLLCFMMVIAVVQLWHICFSRFYDKRIAQS